jgi:hypothetical protein
VGSRFVIVAEIRRQGSLEMASVQDDVVVQTLPSNRAEESLGVWILPWALRCSQNLLHAERLDSQLNFSTVPTVPIAEEILGRVSAGERFYDLLCRPSSGRMLGHIDMQHLATVVFQENEYEQYPHGDCRHSKEIDRDHLADMVVQEGSPRLVRRPPEVAQDARHGAFGEGDTEHRELTMDPRCAPERIGRGHLLDQSAEFCGRAGATSTRTLRVGQPGPEFAEPFALPADDGVGLGVDQRMSPVGPHAAKSNPKYPIQGRQQRPLPFSLNTAICIRNAAFSIATA